MQAVSITKLNPNLMTKEQFKELKKWLKKNNPRGSEPAGTLHWMEAHGIKDIKANIAVLTGLPLRCDDYHILEVKVSDWEKDKHDDPNQHMKDWEWDEYIDNIIYNTTEGESVGDWDAKKVNTRVDIQEQELTEACNRLQAVKMRVNVNTVQNELKFMGRENPMSKGYIEGFLEDYLPTVK